MRMLLLSAVATLGLSAVSPVAAQTSCANPTEFSAFQVRALQSHLMVGALTCDFRDQYNAVVIKHRSELDRSRLSIISYFNRTARGRGQSAFNTFDTELANTQASHSMRRGDQFCREVRPIFAEVLGLPNPAEVQKYAVSRALPQPGSLVACPAPAAAPAAATRR